MCIRDSPKAIEFTFSPGDRDPRQIFPAHLAFFHYPCSEGQRLANVSLFEMRKIGKQLFDGMTLASIVIRLNCCTS